MAQKNKKEKNSVSKQNKKINKQKNQKNNEEMQSSIGKYMNKE